MKSFTFSIVCLLLCSFFLIACGDKKGDASKTETGKTETGNTEATEVAKEYTDGKTLSAAIEKDWKESIAQVVTLMEEEKDLAKLKTKIEGLRNATIDKMVKYGAIKKDFSDSEKKVVDTELGKIMGYGTSDPLLDKYFSLANELLKKDRDTYLLAVDFNIITQYADYELLKKQTPKEAERLGIK